MCVKTLGAPSFSLSSTLSILLSFRPTGNQTGWNDHTKSPKCLLLCSLACTSKGSSFNIVVERTRVNLCCLATDLTTILADNSHSLHAKNGVHIKVGQSGILRVKRQACEHKFSGLKCQNAWVEKVNHYCYLLSAYMCPWETFRALYISRPQRTGQFTNMIEKKLQVYWVIFPQADYADTQIIFKIDRYHFTCFWLQWSHWRETTVVLSEIYSNLT